MHVVVRKHTTNVVVVNRPTLAKIAARGAQGVRGADGQQGPAGRDGAGQVPARMFRWGDAPQVVFTAPSAGLLTVVRLQYLEAFNAPASVVLGTAAAPDAAMPAAWNNPRSVLEFENSPDLPLAEGETLVLTIDPGASSAGEGLLFLSFLPNA